MNRLGRAWRASGLPARALLIGAIKLYRVTMSGWFGGQCRFYPSCSHYAEDAIRSHGAIKGSARAAWRLLRCNPFGKGGIDPPGPLRAYENVSPSGGRKSVAAKKDGA